jgi:hydroxypyruvate reductase
LVSGGGSALFEDPEEGVSLADLRQVNAALLKSEANIVEINTIRKHLSKVKGGRFAQHVSPAKIVALVLSDVWVAG